jgi:GWxTD domain-containing protein
MMKKIIKNMQMAVLSIGLLMISGRLQAQLPEFNYVPEEDVPHFYYDIVTLAAQDTGMSLMRLSAKIAYDELQFIRVEDRYQADYEVSVTVLDQNGDQTDGKILSKTITVYDFAETNSHKDFDLSQCEFTLRPGTYELILGMMDKDARKTGRQKTQVVVPDYFAAPLDVSDILLVDYAIIDSTGELVTRPNVLSNYGDEQTSLYLWVEIYNRDHIDSVKVIYRIKNLKGEELRKQEHYRRLDGERTTHIVEMPRGDLNSGRYQLELIVESDGLSVKRTHEFSIRWVGMPAFASDLDKAIEQMKHIAKDNVLKQLRNAKGEEKQALFQEFWKRLDPTPGTRENELMEEYYRRVEVANANFSSYREGWKTDRGMVYIILGPPDDIDRQPFAASHKPREIWYYYKINRALVFIDRTGLGEYRLSSPFWDIFNRVP